MSTSKTKEQGRREPYTHGPTRIRAHVVGFSQRLPWTTRSSERQLQGSLSQVQVFLIRVLVLALCAFLSTPCVGVEFFPPQGTIHAAMHGD
jgi:hypothetical protein